MRTGMKTVSVVARDELLPARPTALLAASTATGISYCDINQYL